MSPQHTAPSRPFRWESRRELAPGPGSFLSSVWLCRLCHGGRGDLSWKEPAGWARGRCVCPHRSAGPWVAMAEPPRWVCLDQGSTASLPSSSGPERGAWRGRHLSGAPCMELCQESSQETANTELGSPHFPGADLEHRGPAELSRSCPGIRSCPDCRSSCRRGCGRAPRRPGLQRGL